MQVKNIKHNLKSIALLEAIISPDWESRYFSYNSNWNESSEMASMRDGQGTSWHLWITDNSVAWKLSEPTIGIIEDIDAVIGKIPEGFENFYTEPAFSIDEATCIWYFKDNSWNKFGFEGESINRAAEVFQWTAKEYKEWAESYYERELPLKAIQLVFDGSITEEVVLNINPDASITDLLNDIEEIGIEADF